LVKKYYGNGKILLTGEYLVMDGAKAISLPVKFGQHSVVRENETEPGIIHWKAKEHDMVWFESSLDLSTLKVLSSTHGPTTNMITDILLTLQEEYPSFVHFESLSFEHTVNFPLSWGLGSSSSLISNMATWAGIDPYDLHERVSGGSGYDVFTARCHSPIVYQLLHGEPHVDEVKFVPPFHKQLYFVYQGKKQNTALEVEEYRKNKEHFSGEIGKITKITELTLKAESLNEFEQLLKEHDAIISDVLGRKTLAESLFSDYKYGYVKSLGAWGGDFMLFTLHEDHHPQELLEYLKQKELTTIFQFKDLILDQ